MLLLGDFSLVLLTLLQLYSFSLVDIFLVLFILPFGILLPFPAGINALFSHGPRRSAGLARVYALWNVTSLVNVVSCNSCHFCFILCFVWFNFPENVQTRFLNDALDDSFLLLIHFSFTFFFYIIH